MDVVVRVLHDAVALLQREGDPGLVVRVGEVRERFVLEPLPQEQSIFDGVAGHQSQVIVEAEEVVLPA